MLGRGGRYIRLRLCGLSDEPTTDKDELSTTALIRSIMFLIDHSENFEISNDGIENGSIYFGACVPKDIIIPKYEDLKSPLIGDFIKEYIEIKKVLKMDEIPQHIKDSLVEVLINKYKDKSTLGLFGK